MAHAEIAPEAQQRVIAPLACSLVEKTEEILLAEDNAVNQKLMLHLLEKRGYSVTLAVDGLQALEECKRRKFDLILMDVQMPGMDGFEATAAIRARERITGARIPIIAMTAHAMSGYKDQCLAEGMDDYIAKPIHKAELMKVIGRIQAAAAASA